MRKKCLLCCVRTAIFGSRSVHLFGMTFDQCDGSVCLTLGVFLVLYF